MQSLKYILSKINCDRYIDIITEDGIGSALYI